MSRPKNATAHELAKVEVHAITEQPQMLLRCNHCGAMWSPEPGSGGRLPRGYWKCPEGCNWSLGRAA